MNDLLLGVGRLKIQKFLVDRPKIWMYLVMVGNRQNGKLVVANQGDSFLIDTSFFKSSYGDVRMAIYYDFIS